RQLATRQDYPSPNLKGEPAIVTIPEISFQAGFTARELTPQLAAILHASAGVLVSKVARGSQAERAGLKAGDVIVGAQERTMVNMSQLQALFATQRGTVVLKVVRTREPIVVSLNIQ
ncbi:MAG TPA: PDZ domain-containing protein, partial [Blastocatellia bacterium]|nr:PDZ domain-containing protein [Blastocatellia bacterium]